MEIDERSSARSSTGPSSRHSALVLERLAATPTPVTAQELFAAFRERGERVGLATVYRALHDLERRGLVHAIRRPAELAYRACSASQHDHLVCETCGLVGEIPRRRLDQWFETAAPPGFRPSREAQQIDAVCDRCSLEPSSASD